MDERPRSPRHGFATVVRALVTLAALTVGGAALTSCGSSSGDTAPQEHARAVAYGEMWVASYPESGDFAHVARAIRIAPRLWHVELKRNGRTGWGCLTIQLDRFYVHQTSNGASRGGVEFRQGHCPKGA
jgi:hypothetical protein